MPDDADATGIFMIRRVGTFIFAIMAAALSCVALVDVYLHGQFTLFDPRLLGGLAVVGTAFLLFGIMSMRARAEHMEGRADRLKALTGELETFITALEAANKRLHASEARYKGLVDAQGDAITRRTSDGRITYANEAFYKLFGARPEDIVGTVFRPEPHPDAPPLVLGRLAGRELGRERVSYDQHIKTVAGYRWIAWEDYAIRDQNGHLVEIQSVGRDVTERKGLEVALTEARDKAQDANRAKSHFLATMSHEIRTPMNGVLGMARLLLETSLTPDQKTYADAIRQSGLALLSLIEDILDFSKIESGALVIEQTDVALHPLVEGVAELLATRAHSKGIDIVTAITADVPKVITGDAIRLRQVLTNLVGNAIKFTEKGGVLVSATIDRDSGEPELRFMVRDTGIGVPLEKQAQIFDEFVQADSSHARRFEGTGLGLAISKRIVDAMGGKIGISTSDDTGSVFWMTLPLKDMPPAPAEDAGSMHGRCIALFSESVILRAGLKLQLAACGADMIEPRTPETLQRLKTQCNVLLFDAGNGGSETLRDVSGLDIPAVALLSPQHRASPTELRARGYSGYLTKPIRQGSLETRLKAVIAGQTEMETATTEPVADKRAGKSLSILLAEDNPVNALLARELLRRRGHIVHEVPTGEGAVAACADMRFDLVVMDLHMPGLDGIEATRLIRKAEQASKSEPVIIYALTADALETGRRACLEAGMNGFLTKPVDPAELDAVLAGIAAPAAEKAA